MTVDTACSSSLTSLHMAFNALLLGQGNCAINASANLMMWPETPAAFRKTGMLALDGRCKTLDCAADGYVRAEAGGAMLLEATCESSMTLSAAYGILRGSAVNQDGRSSTLTAPNGPAQQEVLRKALVSGHLLPADLAAVQMHGTGTTLGDPIEVGALAAVFAASVSGSRPGSNAGPTILMASKSLVGHSEPAAGMMGVAHAQMAMTMRTALPVLHLVSPNPYATAVMQHGCWSLPRSLGILPMPTDSFVPVSGVSSFAFQGTNAHALVSPAPTAATGKHHPVGTTWQHASHWVTPPQFGLASGVSTIRQLAVFQLALLQPQIAPLHQIAYHGTSVLTLGCLLEVAAEAMAQLAPRSISSPALLASVISMLVAVSASSGTAWLQLAVQPVASSFELSYVSSAGAVLCGSGRSEAAAMLTGGMAGAWPASTRPAWLPEADLRQSYSALAAMDFVAAQQQNMALGPQAVDAALHLGNSGLVSSIAAVLLPGTSSIAPPACAMGNHGAATLFSDKGSAAAHLTGVGTKLVTASTAVRAADIMTSAPEKELDGLLYRTAWLADAPKTKIAPSSSSATCLQGNSVAAALAAVQQASVCATALAAVLSACQASAPAPIGTRTSDVVPALQGMLKSVVQEVPSLSVDAITTDKARHGWVLELGTSPLTSVSGAHGTAVQACTAFVLRLLAVPPALDSGTVAAPAHLGPGAYLVTGGSGMLGSYAALWLLQLGAQSVVLLSRSGCVVQAVQHQAATAPSQQQLVACKADFSSQSDVVGLLTARTVGVLHAGGVLADATLTKQTNQSLRQVRRESWLIPAPTNPACLLLL